MKNWYLFLIFVLIAGTAFSGEPSGRIADLQPELKEALTHDDACVRTSADPLQNPVETQQIVSGGHASGVIAAPQDECDCRNGNCSTFVYLRSGDSYKLALEDRFASLHPMKISKNGLPSLSGKFQVSEAQEETTVYDWNGKAYLPSLCATVTQRKNVRTPSITRHPCKSTLKRD